MSQTKPCMMLITYADHVCQSRMLITFERVWVVGRFDLGRSLFVVPQHPRAGTVAYRRCFRDIPGHTKQQRAKKG